MTRATAWEKAALTNALLLCLLVWSCLASANGNFLERGSAAFLAQSENHDRSKPIYASPKRSSLRQRIASTNPSSRPKEETNNQLIVSPPVPDVNLRSDVGVLSLSDVALVTCVDGTVLGIDRKSGRKLWSIGATASLDSSPVFEPLIRATYGPRKLSFADIVAQARAVDSTRRLFDDFGIYVIEPSGNGDIYLLTTRKEAEEDRAAFDGRRKGFKLSKLPLNLPQLVALSPFSFAGDDSRIFVGKKESKLVELNILTGEVGAVYGEDAFLSSKILSNQTPDATLDKSDTPWTLVARSGKCGCPWVISRGVF